MALLNLSPGISLLARRESSAGTFPAIRSRNARFRVRSIAQDLERNVLQSRVVDPSYVDNVMWYYGQLKQQSEETPSGSTSDEEAVELKKKQDYYVNTGYAIRTLREEFPELFYKELSFDIYRDDIVFRDPLNTFSGIENYKSIFWALRFNGKIFFKALWVDIMSVWQPMENVIMVRWTVHGIPRFPWESGRSRFDGTSEYKLDKDGKIYEHKVHNIASNGPRKFQILAVDQLIQSISCPSIPKPTYFEFSSSFITDHTPLKFKDIKHFVSSILSSLKVSDTDGQNHT